MPRLNLFSAFGVELEYMLVDALTLDVRPITDALLEQVAGSIVSEIEFEDIAWSNELVLHVIELKTNGPAPKLAPLASRFQEHVGRVNAVLAKLGARLMPSAMHPWMDPFREMRLWPHDNSPIYDAFNRIFDCRGHGWANLQSMHVNLPFADDAQFGRLHAAIRLLLPIMPGLSASSPVMDGRVTGLLDSRLEVYRTNSQKIPSIAGRVIPERAFTEADYNRLIFEVLFADIAPHDPDGVLKDEFLNARGAIARFGRGAIEIRVLDVQECPAADLGICQAIVAVLKAMTEGRWSGTTQQQAVEVEPLHRLLLDTIRDADQAVIDDADYLAQLGWTKSQRCSVGELWQHLVSQTKPCGDDPASRAALDVILTQGPLARRIVRRVSATPSRELLRSTYGELCECLAAGRMFV